MLPQWPQLLVSVPTLTSQPLPWLLSQSAKPVAQPEHLPFAQVTPNGQTLPQTPQFFGSAPGSVSHPLEGLPSQSAYPPTQSGMAHAPALQVPGMPFGSEPQR